MTKHLARKPASDAVDYGALAAGIFRLLEQARRKAAGAVNTILTTAYWEIGRRIVDHEQNGKGRAEYGTALLERLSVDLTRRLGRGFSVDNLERMRLFYLRWPLNRISAPALRNSGDSRSGWKSATALRKSNVEPPAAISPLSWGHYPRLMRVEKQFARIFYPVGLILCAQKDEAVAHYALEGLPNKVLASEYKTTLPEERKLAEEVQRAKLALDARRGTSGPRREKQRETSGKQ